MPDSTVEPETDSEMHKDKLPDADKRGRPKKQKSPADKNGDSAVQQSSPKLAKETVHTRSQTGSKAKPKNNCICTQ